MLLCPSALQPTCRYPPQCAALWPDTRHVRCSLPLQTGSRNSINITSDIIFQSDPPPDLIIHCGVVKRGPVCSYKYASALNEKSISGLELQGDDRPSACDVKPVPCQASCCIDDGVINSWWGEGKKVDERISMKFEAMICEIFIKVFVCFFYFLREGSIWKINITILRL